MVSSLLVDSLDVHGHGVLTLKLRVTLRALVLDVIMNYFFVMLKLVRVSELRIALLTCVILYLLVQSFNVQLDALLSGKPSVTLGTLLPYFIVDRFRVRFESRSASELRLTFGACKVFDLVVHCLDVSFYGFLMGKPRVTLGTFVLDVLMNSSHVSVQTAVVCILVFTLIALIFLLLLVNCLEVNFELRHDPKSHIASWALDVFNFGMNHPDVPLKAPRFCENHIAQVTPMFPFLSMDCFDVLSKVIWQFKS